MENKQTLWGLPINEARRVIEVYKYTHKMPSKDYQEGFEDGVKYMCEHISNVVDEALEEVDRKSKEHMQPTVKAIPIELIEKEIKRLDEDIKWAWYYGNVALDKMEYLKMWLTIKLEDWEKENE